MDADACSEKEGHECGVSHRGQEHRQGCSVPSPAEAPDGVVPIVFINVVGIDLQIDTDRFDRGSSSDSDSVTESSTGEKSRNAVGAKVSTSRCHNESWQYSSERPSQMLGSGTEVPH